MTPASPNYDSTKKTESCQGKGFLFQRQMACVEKKKLALNQKQFSPAKHVDSN